MKGLVIGSGIATGMIVLLGIFWVFVIPVIIGSSHVLPPENEVNEEAVVYRAPEISEQFLGYTGRSQGRSEQNPKVLAPGSGEIVGSVISGNRPVEGLRLRLLLNGTVYSQWVETDKQGRYVVHVPYGDYLINGYQIDYGSANRVLPGKLAQPSMEYFIDRFTVKEDRKGQGIDFIFVDPVRLVAHEKVFASASDVRIEWKPYPGASTYRVRLSRESAKPWSRIAYLSERPETTETVFRPLDYLDSLEPGDYMIEIEALDELGRAISRSPRPRGYSFRVKDSLHIPEK